MTETEKNQILTMHDPVYNRNITEKPSLNDNLFARELGYQISLSIAECLLKSKLLTVGEIHQVQKLLLEQYRPPLGTLLAEAG